MKHNIVYPVALFLMLILSACGMPTADPTPTTPPQPTSTWWSDPTPAPAPTPTSEPAPEPTPFLSYEDYFAQTIDYGSIFEDAEGVEYYYDHVEWMNEANPTVLALVQEMIPNDTLGLIPKTMKSVADRCLYVFWAGGEEGAYLYRFYAPTETLDLVCTIPEEEFAEKYFYTPQTEATSFLLNMWDLDCRIGERVCLLSEVGPRTNQLYEWSTANPRFLALFDEMAAHKEDYPLYDWDGMSYDELVPLIESSNWEIWEEPFLRVHHCINAATGEYQEKESHSHGNDQYEVQW